MYLRRLNVAIQRTIWTTLVIILVVYKKTAKGPAAKS